MNLFKRKKNYYEILGVNEVASQQEIENAFNLINEKYNPEKVSNLKEEELKFFSKAKKAYETLSDVSKRKQYDKKLFADVDTFEYEDSKKTVEKEESKLQSEQKNIQPDENKKEKLTVYPKATETLGKNKYRLIASGLAVVAALAIGYKLGKANSSDEVTETTITETENNNEEEQIQETKLLTSENIDEKVQEILEDNKSRGLNIDPTFIRSALFITNIDYLNQEDIKKMWENNDLNIIEEIQNMYNYTSAVGTHNNNVALGQKEGKYVALSNLAFDEEDKTILRELDTEFVDLVNGLHSDMTSEEFQESFKYITEFYTGFGYLTTNGTEYSNYSLTVGGGLLSEQYWPMFSVIYADSKYITSENKVDIKTLSYGTDGTDAVINGSKYLGSIVNHESLQCLEDNQELESDKTLTKAQ